MAFEVVRADLLRHCDPSRPYKEVAWDWGTVIAALSRAETWAVLEYRFRRWGKTLPAPWRQAIAILGGLTRRILEAMTGIQLAGRARIGPGLYVNHLGGTVVGSAVVAGENLNLSHGATLGDHRGSPRLGDCVFVGPGARVFGPIRIGDNVAIGANAVVDFDVPAGAIAVATRAQVIEGRPNMRDPVPDDVARER